MKYKFTSMRDNSRLSSVLALSLVFSALFYFYILYLLLIGSVDIGFFDGALQVLAGKYLSLGFIPYKDFGFVYPPGNVLFSSLFANGPMVNKFFFYVLGYVGLNLVGYWGIFQLNKTSRIASFELVIYFLLNAVVIHVFGVVGAFHIFLLQLTVIFSLVYLESEKTFCLPVIFFLNTILVWFRWDWPLFLVILGWLLLLPQLFLKLSLKRSFHVVLISSLGNLFGFIVLYIYLYSLGVMDMARKFIFEIPLVLTRTYRDLPLPSIDGITDPNLSIYMSIFVVGVYGYLFIRQVLSNKDQRDKYLSWIFLLVGYIVIFLPYAFGRSDSPHFIPLWYAVGMSWIILNASLEMKNVGKYIILLSFLPMIGWFNRNALFKNPVPNYSEESTKTALKDCQKEVKGLTPASIFVGRITYQRYLYSIASLYFVFPNTKPAAPFLLEEPGIQNTCEYGALVVKYLKNSDRPMLAFLEKGIYRYYENKATADMKSCGLIEEYLEKSPYEKVGECKAYSFPFEIRMYK